MLRKRNPKVAGSNPAPAAMNNFGTEKEKPVKRRKRSFWLLFILVFSFTIALGIGLASEAFQANSVIVCVIIICVLILIAFIGDVFAMSVTYADLENFNAMASRKIRGAKTCIRLVKNRDRVASILSDILGDVCATVAGAIGAGLSIIITNGENFSTFQRILVFAAVSAAIASVGVFVKAIAKRIGMKHSTKIVLFLGRCLSLFKRN